MFMLLLHSIRFTNYVRFIPVSIELKSLKGECKILSHIQILTFIIRACLIGNSKPTKF